MHCHLEIIMPPVEDVELAVAAVLRSLSQDCNERHGFYDWCEIGGRWDGVHHPSNVSKLRDISPELEAERVIIAHKTRNGAIEPVFMISREFFNGVSFIPAAWDGHVVAALGMHKRKLTPTDDWLVVTVDYHS